MSKEYTPVLIITLNRINHLEKCVESLKRNSLAKETDLYIGVDFPPCEKYENGYSEVLSYVETINGFRNVYIVKHPKNVGPAMNHSILRKMILETHEKYIFSEDDNEFSPNYLEFMNCMLDENRTDSVLAINGYGYPIECGTAPGEYVYLDTYFSGFGYGIWKENWKLLDENVNKESFLKYYKNFRMIRKFRAISPNQYCNFVKGMTEYIPDLIKDGEVRKVDLSFGIFAFFNGMKIVSPAVSKVKNWGYDGSGVNCNIQERTNSIETTYRNYNYMQQPMDEKSNLGEICPVSEEIQDQINKQLNNFFYIPRKELFVTDITYLASIILGLNNTKRIISILKK